MLRDAPGSGGDVSIDATAKEIFKGSDGKLHLRYRTNRIALIGNDGNRFMGVAGDMREARTLPMDDVRVTPVSDDSVRAEMIQAGQVHGSFVTALDVWKRLAAGAGASKSG